MVARIGPGASPSGDPEAGVLPGVWGNSTPEYFSPTRTARLLGSPSIDSNALSSIDRKAVSSIDILSSLRQLLIARQTDNSSVTRV
ncbi:hypothetical protein F2Q69_00059621 [Brassica cretica]|uniref:Uncharacterized protein n=1 Tax=Brassica cretica TaxID=69181 RepID=A0A8S9RE73_BRACR|nr:hypothetical protein F2Q69_00059621 [Brassica cretica]